MFELQIENSSLTLAINEYLYKNKDKLHPQRDTTFILYNAKEEGIKSSEKFRVGVGLGYNVFFYKEHKIHIEYKKEGNPKSMHGNIDYYKRMTLSCESEAILIEFVKLIRDLEKVE